VAFSPDGQRIVSGSYDNTLKVWDAETGQETLTLKGHTATVESVAWSPDGRRIASSSQDGTIRLWDASNTQRRVSASTQAADR
jgi:eukaryotic-like serine/threonine-protein kinase